MVAVEEKPIFKVLIDGDAKLNPNSAILSLFGCTLQQFANDVRNGKYGNLYEDVQTNIEVTK